MPSSCNIASKPVRMRTTPPIMGDKLKPIFVNKSRSWNSNKYGGT